MTTPVENAMNGFRPALANSRKRVVSPMLRKQKIIVFVGLVPLAEREDHPRDQIEQQEGRDEPGRSMAQYRGRSGEDHQPEAELGDIAQDIG